MKKPIKKISIGLLVAIVILFTYGFLIPHKVTLFVSNQSFAIDPVDITVKIDDEIVVNKNFYVGSQHNYSAIDISLTGGSHTIKVNSKNGDAVLKQDFFVFTRSYLRLEYWYYPNDPNITPRNFEFVPKHFSLETSLSPPIIE